nr:non-ribosomal peptide synthetase [uncultured Clostridium sp.]
MLNTLNRITNEFNNTKTEYPRNKTIHSLFEEQVKRTPDKVVAVFQDSKITYRELNERANKLSYYLREKGTKPDSVVGIMMDRSIEMLVSILGVLKAGAAYLPIDPDLPQNRVEYMLNNSGAIMLIVKKDTMKNISYTLLQDKKNQKEEFVYITEQRSQIKDLDHLPIPNRSLVNYEEYRKYIGLTMVKNTFTIQGSRGCPYNCAYCHKIWPKSHIARSAEHIFEEVLLYYNIGVRRFAFLDDIFNLNIKNSSKFFQLVLDHNMDIQIFFPNGVRGDILTKEYIDLMMKAGTKIIGMSLETASPRLQKLIQKNLNIDRLKENLNYIAETYPEVILELNFMQGFPSETEEEALMTLDFVKDIKWLHFPYFHILKIFPDTDMETLALNNGVDQDAIRRSITMAYHELPETLPFDKNFTIGCQTDFLNSYFLNKERLLKVLPLQMKIMTEDELVQKYDSYLPIEIKNFQDILDFVHINKEELGDADFVSGNYGYVENLNEKISSCFEPYHHEADALKILFLDLSQYFSEDNNKMLYDVIEPPLGHMYIMTYLKHVFGDRIHGKIAKSRIDFNSYDELKSLIEEFKPDVIGVRTLTFYQDFFHQTLQLIRQWGVDIPIIAGGPHITSSYKKALLDKNIDIASLGEGEVTIAELIQAIMNHEGKIPPDDVLKDIHGIAFLEKEDQKSAVNYHRDIIFADELSGLNGSIENLSPICEAGNLAYVIYTSGSTGTPKGVMVEHRALVNLCYWHNSYYQITENDKSTLYASISFDAGVWELFPYIICGAQVHMLNKDIRLDIQRLNDYFNENNISVSFLPTQVCEQFMLQNNKSLRYLLTGGDKLNRFTENNYVLVNNYGPTENTVVASNFVVDKKYNNIPIGKPIDNTRIYMINGKNELCLIGEEGEVCIGGESLARGYINDPELTSEKFVDNPIAPGERIYRTGDLGRWLPDGNIEFLGRIDYQVKIRGYRIELGEIENQVLNFPGINEAVVIAQEDPDNNKYLCAYFTGNTEIDTELLKQYLLKAVASYMVPAYFMQLNEMPVSVNGKIDRKQLPAINKFSHENENYMAPESETEKALMKIWCKLFSAQNIGINDSFTALGGHSLKAMELITLIKEEMGIEVPLNQLFKLSTIKELGKYMSENNGEMISDDLMMEETDETNMAAPFPVTGVQLAYLMGRNERFEIGGAATNLTVEFEFHTDLHRFSNAIQKLIDRHAILRTVCFENGTQQILQSGCNYQLDVVDLSHKDERETEHQILAFRDEMISGNIDPGIWPLFKIKAFVLANGNTHFSMSIDPLICDDSSLKIVTKEFKLFYENPDLILPELRFNFRDYVLAQNRYKNSARYRRDEAYWLDKLNDFPVAPQLPLKCHPSDIQKPKFQKLSSYLTGEQWQKLKQKAIEKNITPASILCSAYAYVLAYWSNQNHFAINLTVFNRLPFHKDVAKMVGDFTTLMLLDIDVSSMDKTFWKFADIVQNSLLEALEHRNYDGVDFIRNIGKKHDMKNRAIMPIVFTSVLNENSEDSFDHIFDFNKIKFLNTRTSQVYIDNQIYEMNSGIYITWDYVEQLFDEKEIGWMFFQYKKILEMVLAGHEVTGIEMSEDTREIIEKYNDTDTEIVHETLHGLFVKRVKTSANCIAVRHHEEEITYKELDEKSNQVAAYLMERGIKSGDFVGVIGKRCIGTVINLLGILKAGAAYIPLDPDYPEERILYIKEKSECNIIIHPDLYLADDLCKYPVDMEETMSSPECLAYVIFTSGSTGKPKGVQITHQAAVNTILDINNRFQVTEKDRMLGISSLCFDLSVYDIFGALASGASLVLIDDQRDIYQIKEIVEKERITVWNSVPAIMEMTANLYDTNEQLNSLRLVLLSGDWIPLMLPGKIKNIFTGVEVISLGGATEASIWSIYYPIKEVPDTFKSIPYGMPLSNQKFYVLNQNLDCCPIDVEGELYIGGAGVAKGYINDEKRTKEAYIQHPEFGYIYRTGDYGVLRREGYIEFLGRTDGQVKIRGFRVELGEIENCLMGHPDVKKAIVTDIKDGDGNLNLYAFLLSDKPVNANELKDFAKKSLPMYMIPVMFLQIDEVPVSLNGKVEKRALEELISKGHKQPNSSDQVVEPRNETQQKLVDIWKDVFKIPEIGITNNYYELGGDSLKAISIVSQIYKKLNMRIHVGEIFEKDTIELLSAHIMTEAKQNAPATIQNAEKKDYYITSPSQKRMYMLSMMEENRGSYQIPMALLIKGELDIKRLESSLHQIIERHESLRTSFVLVNNELMQKVHHKVDFHLGYKELISGKDELDLERLAGQECKSLLLKFNLSKLPLMSGKVIRLKKEEHLLVLNFHHIIADGMSQGILMDELLELYYERKLPEVEMQYKDYAEWYEGYRKSHEMELQKTYWLDTYKDIPPKLSLPCDYPRPAVQSFEGANLFVDLGKELTGQVKNMSRLTGATLYMTMLTAYYVLLNKCSGREDIVVGSAAAGRLHENLENVFGTFVNTIALRNQVNSSSTFYQFLNEVKDNTIEAFEKSDYQFDELIRSLNYERDMCSNPLFDTMFVLEDMNLFRKKEGALCIEPVLFELNNAKFDLTFTVLDGDALMLNIEYSTKLFKKETVERLSEYYINILKEIVAVPDKKIGEIQMLPETEKQQLLYQFNPCRNDTGTDQTIHGIFEERAAKNPENIAVVMENRTLSYGELNQNANQLAVLLKKKKWESSQRIVAIVADKSPELITGMFAVLKAGGAYLLIDPSNPAERIRYMLSDSGCESVMTQRKYMDLINEIIDENCDVIDIEEHRDDIGQGNDLTEKGKSDDLAYLVYTSGSTGEPKGVMIEHKSVVNLCNWHIDYYDILKNDVSTSYASISFDAFVWEVFPYLLNGNTLHLIPESIRLNIHELNRYFESNGITICFLPTQICEQFMTVENHSLRKLLTGGDKLNYYKHGNYELYNNYGPTENTVVSTSVLVTEGDQNIPIGRPIANTSAYILNKDRTLAPMGVAGELCLGGLNLARGYWNRETLTDEKFIPNPFLPSEKMYLTGDLARWTENGTIEFLGRMDQQVKIRGYRIELGEIESKLLSNEHIREAAVIARGKTDKVICAYLVSDAEIGEAYVKDFLSQELPNYMIPAQIAFVEKIPLTVNGKLNVKELPEIGMKAGHVIYEAPTDELEVKIASMWQEILSVTDIGINHNFFELGGHSLNATSLAAGIYKELNVELPLRRIFETPTIKGICDYIRSSVGGNYRPVCKAEKKDYYKLSSPQKRLYVLDQIGADQTAYNIPLAIKIHGKLDIKRFCHAFQMLIQRHDALRTSFEIVDGEPVQIIHDEVDFEVSVGNISEEEVEAETLAFTRRFDLSKAPLLRAAILKMGDQENLFLIDMHHMISDGTSMSIIISDLMDLYGGKDLPKQELQYADYSEWQENYWKENIIKQQEKYWLDVYQDEVEVLNMPLDFQRPARQSFQGDIINFKIEKELYHKLDNLAKETGTTMYMLMLAGYTALISKYAGQDDIVVGMPIEGRSHADTESIVGMFVNTLALRTFPNGEKPFLFYLNELKETTINAYENQDYPLEDLVEKLNITRDLGRNPLFDTMLIFQDMESMNLESEELKFDILENKNRVSKFDFSLTLVQSKEEFAAELQYCKALFKRETIKRLSEHFINLLTQMVKNPNVSLNELELTGEEEKNRLIYGYNQRQAPYPKEKTVDELFREQAKNSRSEIALVFEEKEMTYGELDQRSDALADRLWELGVGEGDVVGILADRSMEMIVAILGILKSGCAYLPLDTEYPAERIEYMIKDSKVQVICTTEGVDCGITFHGGVIKLEELAQDKQIYMLKTISKPESLAYVIYTSGSSGKPKGVMLEHRNVNNLVHGLNEGIYKKYKKRLHVALLASYVFDGSVKQIFASLLLGHTLHIVKKDRILDASKLLVYFEEKGIEISDATPAHLRMLTYIEEGVHLTHLKELLVGGDILTYELVHKVYDKLKDAAFQMVNVYGPTECCVDSAYYRIDREGSKEQGIVPIGSPIQNTQLYILDPENRVLPVGIAGELCISGDGVSRGYLNRKELTEEKFVKNPFVPGLRMYTTGDLARRLADGTIEILGRIDQQVKIRGFRIELEEIEHQLTSNPLIKDAVVAVKRDLEHNNYLAAYLVLNDPAVEADIAGMRESLAETLPDYMIPAYFTILEQMPVTVNGKIDKDALPEPDKNSSMGITYEEPTTAIEKKMVKIWENVLGIEPIGINHNFFVIGGDSIKALQIIYHMAGNGLKLDIRELFAHPRIKELSSYVGEWKKTTSSDEDIFGEVELTPVQKRYFERNAEEKDYFNQSLCLFRKAGLEEGAVTKAFQELVRHHDALRMEFKEENKKVVQNNRRYQEDLFRINVFDCTKDYETDAEPVLQEIEKAAQREISIEGNRLVILNLVKTQNGDYLLFVIHHLLIDGVSWRILIDDFENLYNKETENDDFTLLPKTDSYKDYADALQRYAHSPQLLKETGFWKSNAKQSGAFLPKKMSASGNYYGESETISTLLDKHVTETLLMNTNHAFQTNIDDILITALSKTIKKLTGSNQIKLDLESHGREIPIESLDVSRTIGWFTSIYPVVINIEDDLSMGEEIITVKEHLRKVPQKGIGYGILKYLNEDVEFENERISPILFNYLGEFHQSEGKGGFSYLWNKTNNNVGKRFLRSNSIEINLMILNKELQINTTFHRGEYDRDTINQFNEAFKNNIGEISRYCSGRKYTEKTPSDYGDTSITLEQLASIRTKYADCEIERIYSLGNMQKGMLFHYLQNRNSKAYFEQIEMNLTGAIDPHMFLNSFNEVMKRHEILRASFEYEIADTPKQIIRKDRTLDFKYYDIAKQSNAEKKAWMQELKVQDKEKGFDLEKDPLMRVALIQYSENDYKMVWSHHHIILDGWSLGIIMGELSEIYNSAMGKKQYHLDAVKPYREYIEWLNGQDQEKAIDYWKNYLEGYESLTIIPAMKKSEKTGKPDIKEKQIIFSEKQTRELISAAGRNGVTLNTFIQSIWGLALARYNGTEDIIFGTVVSGREADLSGIEHMVGLFINTIPTRMKASADKSFSSLLKEVQSKSLEANEYNYVSLSDIQVLSPFNRELINHVMVFDNYGIDNKYEKLRNENTSFQFGEIMADEQTNYGFGIIITQNDTLSIRFVYDENIYDESIVHNMGIHFTNIALQAISNPERKVREFELPGKEEMSKLVSEFNHTEMDYPKDKDIVKLFEEQAERTPKQIALVFEETHLTYEDLSHRIYQLAGILQERGLKKEEIIGVMMDRSVEMVISLLAILKAGGAFLPIDMDNPWDRVRYILEDSQCNILLTKKKIMEQLRTGNMDHVTTVFLDEEEVWDRQVSVREERASKDQLAYVIYTSGSTGRPKGVQIEQGSLVNFCNWYIRYHGLGKEDKIGQYLNTSFDASLSEIFPALLSGAALYIFNTQLRMNMIKLNDYITAQGITVLTLPAKVTEQFVYQNNSSLRILISGGSQMKQNVDKPYSIINEYGPTESTIAATSFLSVQSSYDMPIGKPIDNTRIYILDKYQKICPIGVVGELCICGDGLARGYLNRPELTAEKFVEHPYQKGERMYRTGDMARWLADGNIEYAGRTDYQVKINDYRIETQEIENHIIRHEAVTDAAVIARKGKDDNYCLCAYIVLRQGTSIDTTKIKSDLGRKLPAYMIPSVYIKMNALPLTANGKLDVKALPEPDLDRITYEEYQEPDNYAEEKIAVIWKEVLKLEKIGTNYNFFEIGGNSLKAMMVINLMNKKLGVDLSIQKFFENTTIKQLAAFILTKDGNYDTDDYIEVEL